MEREGRQKPKLAPPSIYSQDEEIKEVIGKVARANGGKKYSCRRVNRGPRKEGQKRRSRPK